MDKDFIDEGGKHKQISFKFPKNMATDNRNYTDQSEEDSLDDYVLENITFAAAVQAGMHVSDIPANEGLQHRCICNHFICSLTLSQFL